MPAEYSESDVAPHYDQDDDPSDDTEFSPSDLRRRRWKSLHASGVRCHPCFCRGSVSRAPCTSGQHGGAVHRCSIVTYWRVLTEGVADVATATAAGALISMSRRWLTVRLPWRVRQAARPPAQWLGAARPTRRLSDVQRRSAAAQRRRHCGKIWQRTGSGPAGQRISGPGSVVAGHLECRESLLRVVLVAATALCQPEAMFQTSPTRAIAAASQRPQPHSGG